MEEWLSLQITFVCALPVKRTDFSFMLIGVFSASYGSLARFTDVRRLKQVGSHTVVGAGGDISDMQYLFDKLLESVLYVLCSLHLTISRSTYLTL